jgi:hypothetical protein
MFYDLSLDVAASVAVLKADRRYQAKLREKQGSVVVVHRVGKCKRYNI